ncbi:MAG: hypothetical protein KAS01_00215 [Candidatus Pacebacteria bacterium]|nr:hypothetical protein [Candidatus Paceibacterota bacterium]
MSNINLLPKVTKKTKSEIIDISSIVSLFLIIIPIVISIYFYVENKNFIEEIKLVNSQSNLVEDRLAKEISNNKKFVISETEGKNIEYMLSAHLSFSKIVNYFENLLTDDVYIESYSISDNGDAVSIDFTGAVKDYQSVATQLYIIKQMPEVKKISMKELNQEGADLAFNGVISLNKDIGK